MVIAETAPMLTCTKSNDGFQYELVLRADEGKPTITKIRFGPYLFKPEYQPKPLILGLSTGGPESSFLMHQKSPWGWSRLHWEVDGTVHGIHIKSARDRGNQHRNLEPVAPVPGPHQTAEHSHRRLTNRMRFGHHPHHPFGDCASPSWVM